MLEDRIRAIETRIQSSPDLPEADRAELLEVVASLRAQLAAVGQEHLQRAESASADAGGISGAVSALEATHPQAASLINRLALALSNMGI